MSDFLLDLYNEPLYNLSLFSKPDFYILWDKLIGEGEFCWDLSKQGYNLIIFLFVSVKFVGAKGMFYGISL